MVAVVAGGPTLHASGALLVALRVTVNRLGDCLTALHRARPTPRQVLRIRCGALGQGVRPAEPLKPGRNLGVIQIRIVAAVAADQLECARPAALDSARNDADRLAVPGPGWAVSFMVTSVAPSHASGN
jgi:hypothetical protein